MRELGHEAEVVSLDPPAPDDASAFPCKVHGVGKWFRKYGYTPRLAEWIVANGSRFDAAVLHGVWNHSSIGGWQGLREAGVPYVIFTHGMLDPWFRRQYPLKHLAKQVFWSLWQGRVLRDAGAVLFTCEDERALARGEFKGPGYKERVVAYGASEPPPWHAGDLQAFYETVPALAGRQYLLFMSRIHPKKGCDLLIEAFAEIAPEFPEMDVVIAGPDQVGQRRALERLAHSLGVGERIHWPGMISGSAKAGALQTAQAMILPSHQENFGIVVAEALAYGRPVLISNRVNIWREIIDASAGLVAEDTVSGTRTLLREFLSLSAEKRGEMGRAGLSLYRDRFTPVAAARDLERVLSSLMTDSVRM